MSRVFDYLAASPGGGLRLFWGGLGLCVENATLGPSLRLRNAALAFLIGKLLFYLRGKVRSLACDISS